MGYIVRDFKSPYIIIHMHFWPRTYVLDLTVHTVVCLGARVPEEDVQQVDVQEQVSRTRLNLQ